MKHFLALCLAFLLTATALEAGTYGAVVYSTDTTRWGYSYGQPNKARAINAAHSYAKDRSCQTIIWGRNVWIAFARGSGSSYGIAYNTSRAHAIQRAKWECLKRSRYAKVVLVYHTQWGN